MPDNLGGRPPYEPDEKTRKYVESMSAAGITQEDIATVVGISVDTLVKYYRDELDAALIKANAKVGQSLYMQAVGGPESRWEQAVPAAAIFWLKTKGRWKEAPHDVNLSGAVGRYDLTKLPDDQLTSLIEILTTIAPSPNPGGGDGGEGSPQG